MRAGFDRGIHLGTDLREAGAQAVAAAGRVEAAVDDVRGEAGHVAVVVDVHELGQVLLANDGERQGHQAAGGRARVEQVLLGADVGREGGDELLADRVQRRVGHLREQLVEVVVKQPRLVGEHGHRGVGAHRADRLRARAGHGGEDEAQFLFGVAESALAGQQVRRRRHGPLAVRQVVQVDEAGVQPVLVGMLGGEDGLDLFVLDDPAGGRVGEEDAARLEAAAAHDAGGLDVEHADLGGEDDQAVGGDPVPAGAQAVAVEHGADHGAVGERDQRGAVPGLHQRRVELVEGPPPGVHLVMVLPRLGDHHEQRVRQRPAAEVEQFEALVERTGVRAVHVDDREQPLDALARLGRRDQRGGEHLLTGAHPVPVALHGVDLAVVRDVAVRVRPRPRRERVGGEPGVHQGEAGLVALVGQVGEERLDLGRGQHALVDDRPGGQGCEVDASPLAPGQVLDALAQAEGHPVEDKAALTRRARHEQLREMG